MNVSQNNSLASSSENLALKLLTPRQERKKFKPGEIIAWYHPMIAEDRDNFVRYLLSFESRSFKFSEEVSKEDFKQAIQNLLNLEKKINNFVFAQEGDSKLAHDLRMLSYDDYSFEEHEKDLRMRILEYGEKALIGTYRGMWEGFQTFFDYAQIKIANLPKDEIKKNIDLIRSYLKKNADIFSGLRSISYDSFVSTFQEENQNKLIRDTQNLKTLLAMFEQKENKIQDELLKKLLSGI